MSTYTPSLGLELITPGSQAGLWGNTTNNSLNLIDQAITGVTPISFAAASGSTYTLTDYNGAEDEARAAVLNVTGTASGANTIVIPNKQKTYFVRNSTGKDITVQTALGTTPCTVGAGYNLPVFCDGNNSVYLAILAPGAGTLTVTGGGTGKTTFTGGFIKSPGGTGDFTSSATVALGSEVSGTLPVTNGGTGKSSLTSGALLFGNGTGAVGEFVGPSGSSGQVATWNGSGWVATAPTTSGVTSVAAGTGISVSGSTGNVTIGNTGVTSISAGSGISISGSTGAITISASASGGVTSFNSRTGAVTPQSSDYSSYYYPISSNPNGYITSSALSSYAPISNPTFTGVVTSSSAAFNMAATTSIFYSSGSGFVGIAVNGVYGFNFYSSGNATASGTWQSLSDERLKENISPVGTTLSKVMQLNPVEFSMKADKSPIANRYGLIAQELEKVFPYVVDDTNTAIGNTENVKAVSYTEIIPLLVKAIQELKAEVDALKVAK